MYECENCHAVHATHHSMVESREKEKCEKCEKGILFKKLSNISFSVDKQQYSETRPGAIVDSTILDLHDELQSEKEKLKNKLWKEEGLENE